MKEEKIQVEITGMTCEHCAKGIEKQLDGKIGIIEKSVNYKEGKGEFIIDPNKISKDEVIEAINKIGSYKVSNILTDANESNNYDLIIIGGGSSAFSAALKANGLKLKTLLVNGGLPLGGTCVNIGCVPSKFLIRAAETIHRASHSSFKGINTVKPTFDFKQIIQQKRELVSELQKKKYLNLLTDLEYVKVIEGFAQFESTKTIVVNGNEKHTALKFIIATGSSTAIPTIEGLDKVPYLTSESLFELEELPQSLIILGAGYIALEIAQAYQRFGTQVTIIQRSENILSKEAKDITDELSKHLTAEGINILTGTSIEKISKDGDKIKLEYSKSGKNESLLASHILIATGIKANTEKLATEKISLELTKNGHVKVNEQLETNVPNIYAVGDVTNLPPFVYTAAYEGNIAVSNAFEGAQLKVDFTSLPWVVFTDPQVAGVGMDEKEAETKKIPYQISVLPLTEVPRSLAASDTRGFIKLIRNTETDQLIGARIVAPEGSELTMEISLAIKYGIKVKELVSTLHPYLTLSESIKLASIGFTSDITKLSCCAS
jgi:mercuric reductase